MKKYLLTFSLTLFSLSIFCQVFEVVDAPSEVISEPSTDEEIFIVVEEAPEFEGGNAGLEKFLEENLKYPKKLKRKGIEGKVFVQFVVNQSGGVEDASVLKGLAPEADSEALRVVKLSDGKWKPGKQAGRVVKAKYALPIRFALKK